MNAETRMLIERHEMLRDAHSTMIQALKYPQTVNVQAVEKAKAMIDAHAVLRRFALKNLG